MDLNSIRATQHMLFAFLSPHTALRMQSCDNQAQGMKTAVYIKAVLDKRRSRRFERNQMIHSVWHLDCSAWSVWSLSLNAHWCVTSTDIHSKEWINAHNLCAFGAHNKWEKCVRPETEQQKSPITIQLELRSNLVPLSPHQWCIIAIKIHIPPNLLFSFSLLLFYPSCALSFSLSKAATSLFFSSS